LRRKEQLSFQVRKRRDINIYARITPSKISRKKEMGMRTLMPVRGALLLLLACVCIVASLLGVSDAQPSSCQSAKEIIASQPEYSILNTLIDSITFINDDVYDIIEEEGDISYTFFAPTNEAFRKVFEKYNFDLNETITYAENSHRVLAYHIVFGKIDEDTDQIDSFPTLIPTGEEIYTDISNSMAYGVGSNATIVETVFEACKGLIYEIDDILLPFEPSDMPADEGDRH